MTTIDNLKDEKALLHKEKKEILEKQKRMMKSVRDEISKELDGVYKKMDILDNQMKSMRKPGIAKTVRQMKKAAQL